MSEPTGFSAEELNDPHARLGASPEVLRAIEMAVEECFRPNQDRRKASSWRHGVHGNWRFSGRTWASPIALGRARPSR